MVQGTHGHGAHGNSGTERKGNAPEPWEQFHGGKIETKAFGWQT